MCSKLEELTGVNGMFRIDLLRNSVPSLKHQARLKGEINLNQNTSIQLTINKFLYKWSVFFERNYSTRNSGLK